MPMRLKQICNWLHIQAVFPNRKISGVSMDTRTLEPGNLFVALKGQNSDGHDFIDQAFTKGAAAAGFECLSLIFRVHKVLLCVPEPLDALRYSLRPGEAPFTAGDRNHGLERQDDHQGNDGSRTVQKIYCS